MPAAALAQSSTVAPSPANTAPARQPICPNVPEISKSTPFPQKAIDLNIRTASIIIFFDVEPGGEVQNVRIKAPPAFQDTAVAMITQLRCVNDSDKAQPIQWPIGFRLD